MTQYWYMRPLFSRSGTLHTDTNEAGSVTQDPLRAYRRYVHAWEKEWEGQGNVRVDRTGGLFAVWELTCKLSTSEARQVAESIPPHQVCVLFGAGWDNLVDFTLPPGVTVNFTHV